MKYIIATLSIISISNVFGSVAINGVPYTLPPGAVISSSSSDSARLPAKAVDGTSASDSRWCTAFMNVNADANVLRTEWIMIDLGQDVSLKSIYFNWETARAANYKLGIRTAAQGISSGMTTVPVQGPTVTAPPTSTSTPITFSDWTQIGSVTNAASVGNNTNLATPDQTFDFVNGTTTGTSVGAMTINENPAVGRYLLVAITKQWRNNNNANANTGSSPYEITIAANTLPVQPPIRILPIGDSITFGAGAPTIPGGYRSKLYQLLTAAGYHVDFVGNQTGNGVNTLPDFNHEGHGGWTIGQLDANLTSWLNNIADPDVILLHIGTNDFGTSYDTTHAIDRWDALITKIATMRPQARIIVTNLLQRGEPYNGQIVAQFNPYVQAKVNAQVALGRKVTFLDMRSAVPLSEMPDSLHPGQIGYDHMADAWAPAIQAVIGVNGDTTAPVVMRAVGAADLTHVTVTFSKPVSDAAATLGNFAISGGLTVTGAVLDPTKRSVVLTTSTQTRNMSHTVTVNNVVDRTSGAFALAANSTATFKGAAGLGYPNNVPESSGYALVYSIDLPTAANYFTAAVPYSVDNHGSMGPYSRIAYYLELQNAAGEVQYLWTSMNAFTNLTTRIGVPTFASGAIFQQSVSGLNVFSNNPRVTTGTNQTGNIEFLPNNYDAANSTAVTGAESLLYDFGDNRATATSGGTYGSMQVHNTSARETVFGFNNWGGSTPGGNIDLGMGNNPVSVNNATDWTFANNGAIYTVKRLQVLVNAPYNVYLEAYPSLTGNSRLASADPDGDGFSNLLEFGFGTDPSVNSPGSITYTDGVLTARGQPTTSMTNIPDGVDFRAVFGRRKDYLAAGLTYTVQFSAGLNLWVNSTDTPTPVASDATMDAVSVPFPPSIQTANGAEKPTFFRVRVSGN